MTKKFDPVKNEIINKFNKHVKGKKPLLTDKTKNNSGREGDWLTKKMGLKKNGLNIPDYKGFELKIYSKKITFGDWSPDYALYHRELSRSDFLKIFGSKKNGRLSWSGSVFPKINKFTKYGQIIQCDISYNILIYYCFSKDNRKNKHTIVPETYQREFLLLAFWDKSSLEKFITNKFGHFGFVIALKNEDGVYTRLLFGPKFNFETFIYYFKKGTIFIDCGMIDGNPRPYMVFRAQGDFWIKLAKKRIKIKDK